MTFTAKNVQAFNLVIYVFIYTIILFFRLL